MFEEEVSKCRLIGEDRGCKWYFIYNKKKPENRQKEYFFCCWMNVNAEREANVKITGLWVGTFVFVKNRNNV